jgi:NAD dependent epimerase/dehydratase family enzyme
MEEFAKTLGKVLNRPSLFPVPKFILKIVVGEAAEVVTASQKIAANKIVDSGYQFKFENLEDALRDLLKQKRT